jgi:hypothetical protein
MTPNDDARDRLRAANPVPPGEEPSADTNEAQAMFRAIVSTPVEIPRARKRSWLRRRAWVLIPVAAIGAAAAGYGLFRKATGTLDVGCYQRPDLTSPVTVLPNVPDGPVAACAPLWQPPGEYNLDGSTPAPRQVACILDSGAIGVFPDTLGSDTCAELKLARYFDAGPRGELEQVLAFRDSLGLTFAGRCFHREEALAEARRQLDAFGLTDWTVEVTREFTAADPCASTALPPGEHKVFIVSKADPRLIGSATPTPTPTPTTAS